MIKGILSVHYTIFSVDFDKPFSKSDESDKPWKTTWFDGAELSYTKHVFLSILKPATSNHLSK